VIIADGLRQRRFGGTDDVLGRTLTLNDEAYTIVGVMPRRFHLTGSAGGRSDLFWLPVDVRHPRPEDSTPQYFGVARLAPGVSHADAQTRADALADQYQQAQPLARTWDLRMRPKTVASVDANARTLMLVLLGAVGFVLLIACANVANLFLSQAAAREREVAVRSALGASRARLIREVLVESTLLGALGGCVGIVLAFWGVRGAVGAAPANLAFVATSAIEIDGRILAAAALLTIAAGVLVGLVPAVRGSRPRLESALRSAGQSATAASCRTSSALVVTEVALALMLLVAAALMTRTFVKLHAIDPGFDLHDLVSFRLALPSDRYPTVTARYAFADDLASRLRAMPRTSDVTATLFGVPPQTGAIAWGVEPEGGDARDSRALFGENWVASNYFRALRMPLLKGRSFEPSDGDDTVVVSRALAEYFWPGTDAIGRRLRTGPKDPWLTVIGIAGNVETRMGDQRLPRQIYFAMKPPPTTASAPAPRRRTYYGFWFTIRTSDTDAAIAGIKSRVRSIDRNLPIDSIGLVEDAWSDVFGRQRFALGLMSVFGGVALVLAAAGVLAVLSQVVRQRTREIAVRVALGAVPADVFRMIVGRGMTLTLIGVGVGMAGAMALSRVLRSLLFEVSPNDPISFAATAALLTAVAFGASWQPTRRAMRIEPAVALRTE